MRMDGRLRAEPCEAIRQPGFRRQFRVTEKGNQRETGASRHQSAKQAIEMFSRVTAITVKSVAEPAILIISGPPIRITRGPVCYGL